jgi:hypothetical protein
VNRHLTIGFLLALVVWPEFLEVEVEEEADLVREESEWVGGNNKRTRSTIMALTSSTESSALYAFAPTNSPTSSTFPFPFPDNPSALAVLFRACIFAIFSSIVSFTTTLTTVVGLVCPIRLIRPIAWSVIAG